MATALIVTRHRDRARPCCDAFRRLGSFPIVVDSFDGAVNVLYQFQKDLIVVHTSNMDGLDASSHDRLVRAAGDTRLIMPSSRRFRQWPGLTGDRFDRRERLDD